MQAIFSFVPDYALFTIDNFCTDFFTSMSWQAMHEKRFIIGQRHQLCSYLVITEGLLTNFLFLFLSHAGPDIGNDQVAVGTCRAHIGCDLDEISSLINEFLVWLKTFGTGDV